MTCISEFKECNTIDNQYDSIYNKPKSSNDSLKYYDSMNLIYNYILSEIIHKYNLISCFKQDDIDDGSTEYFIKLKKDLNFFEKKELRLKIRKDIENYCFENNLLDNLNKFYIYLSRE